MTEGIGILVPAETVVRDGWKVTEVEVKLTVEEKPARSDTPSARQLNLAWGSLVLGAGALTAGGIFTYKTYRYAERYRFSLTRVDEYLTKRNIYLYSSIGAYTLSAACIGLSIYWFATAGKESTTATKPPSKSALQRIRPTGSVARDGALIGIEGRF